MFDKIRKIVIEILTPAPPEGELLTAKPNGAWSINDGIPYSYPIAVPARIREAGGDIEESYIQEASKQFQFQFATNFQQGEPVTMPTTDILTEWDWQTRRDVLENTHLVWARNPIAKAAVRYNRLFAIGDGVQITYQNNDVRELVEAFIEHPDNMLRQEEKGWLETLQVDGELFFRRFFRDDDGEETGETIITVLPPWGIRSIVHDPGFFRRITHYVYSIYQSDGDSSGEQFEEDILADEVHHVAINKLAYEQRGRPDLYAILVWLKAHKALLENLSRNIYFTNVLYDVTLKNAQAGNVAAKRNQYKEPPAGGSIAIHNDKEEWKMMETARTGAGDVEVVRQLKMQIAAGIQLPEYFLGDGENANLASATAQQVPALRKFEDYQDIMRDLVWIPLIRKWVIEPAIKSGLLDAELPQQDIDGSPVKDSTGEVRMVKAVDAFEVRYPPVEQDDPKTIGEALQLAVMNEWMSNETAAGEMPFEIDYLAEKRKIAAEKQHEMDEMNQGLRPRPPNMNGDEENGQGQQGQDADDQDVPAVRGD